MAFAPKIGDWQSAPATASRPVFAIGDIHGRNDLFEPLIAAILRIVDEEKLEKVALVTLGDYVDRGPAGLAVLKKVLDGIKHPKVESICLPGNHEQFLRHFLESKGAERQDILWNWLDNGAGAIARELGLSEAKASDPETFVAAIASDLGLERIEKLFKLSNHFRLDQYLFVHGGIHPLRHSVGGFPVHLALQVLGNANALTTMTGMALAILSGDEAVIKPMSKIQPEFADCLPELLK